MAERIEHTQYEWARYRCYVILIQRIQVHLLFYLLGGYLTLACVTWLTMPIGFFAMSEGPRGRDLFASIGLLSVMVVLAGLLSYGCFRLAARRWTLPMPTRLIRCGRGNQLSVEKLCIPVSTGMGGTMPGSPTRWLVINRLDEKMIRLVQVYYDIDLLKINVALAGKVTA